jgi:hypothetical protein
MIVPEQTLTCLNAFSGPSRSGKYAFAPEKYAIEPEK